MSDEAKAETPGDAEHTSGAEPAAEAPDRVADGAALPPEIASLLRKLIPAVWLLGVIAAGVVSGIELAFLVTAGGVLTLVITLMWSSVQSLTGRSSLGFEEALGMGAPSRVEEEKRAVLRALKDLEYERGVGKITPEDYAELVTKYRAEAKRLMQSVDEALGPAREQVEKQLSARLEREGVARIDGKAAESDAADVAAAEAPAETAGGDASESSEPPENLPESREKSQESQPAPPEEKS